MPRLRPCWSCGAQDAPCEGDCQCAKCVDPGGYDEWRDRAPGEYRRWLADQMENPDQREAMLSEADRWEGDL
jgi:hypothetical protein